MKMQIIGFELQRGVGKTSGKAYEIGQLHTLADLAPAMNDDGVSVGAMGTTYRVDGPLIDKIKGIKTPFMADVVTAPQMRFGKREEVVIDVVPAKAP